MRSVRTKGQTRNTRRPPAPKINTSVLFTGERPIQYRGAYTGLFYIWPLKRPATWGVWMDKRDVPGLLKQVGIDVLDGDYIDELKEKMAEAEKKKKARKKAAEKKAAEEVTADEL